MSKPSCIETGELRAELVRARELLLEPTVANVELVGELLRGAIRKAAALEANRKLLPSSAQEKAALRNDLEGIRKLSAQVGELLHEAGTVNLAWARLLLNAMGGYTAVGTETPLPPVNRLELQG